MLSLPSSDAGLLQSRTYTFTGTGTYGADSYNTTYGLGDCYSFKAELVIIIPYNTSTWGSISIITRTAGITIAGVFSDALRVYAEPLQVETTNQGEGNQITWYHQRNSNIIDDDYHCMMQSNKKVLYHVYMLGKEVAEQ